jgi:hypothetical protein
MKHAAFLWIVAAGLAVWAFPAGAASDADKCEANKNKIAGKYYFCREKAEAKAILTGDPVDYSKCTLKFDDKWNLWENKVPGACPDTVLTAPMNAFIAGQASETAAVIAGTQDVPTCGDNAINVAGEQCDRTALGGESCTTLGFASGSLVCTSCAFDTSGCACAPPTGDAAVGDVLSGKGFSNAGGTGLTGTMPNNGAVTLTPSTADQAIAEGYHNGAGKCAGDTDLAATNIKSGIELFGVAGDSNVVDTSSGDAATGDLLTGKRCWVDGAEVTGSVAVGANVNGGNGLKTFTIPDGIYSGSKTATANDTNLAASNIVTGASIFGVAGAQPPAQPLRTAQTQCDQGAGTLGACPGLPAGQDGSVLKGATRSYTVNANGTVTDNKTGLIWEKLDDNNANGIHDYSATLTWYNAFKKIQVLNGNVAGCIALNNPDACCSGTGTGSCSAFAGQTDWRLPNNFELESIRDMGRFSPSIDPVFNTRCAAECSATATPCSCTRSGTYWSSTTYQATPAYAWIVSFGSGYVDADGKSNSTYVRAVRGGS